VVVQIEQIWRTTVVAEEECARLAVAVDRPDRSFGQRRSGVGDASRERRGGGTE
jgi:hypothetical protein